MGPKRNIETGMKTVQNTMQKLNEKLNKVNKNWKKDISKLFNWQSQMVQLKVSKWNGYC